MGLAYTLAYHAQCNPTHEYQAVNGLLRSQNHGSNLFSPDPPCLCPLPKSCLLIHTVFVTPVRGDVAVLVMNRLPTPIGMQLLQTKTVGRAIWLHDDRELLDLLELSQRSKDTRKRAALCLAPAGDETLKLD